MNRTVTLRARVGKTTAQCEGNMWIEQVTAIKPLRAAYRW